MKILFLIFLQVITISYCFIKIPLKFYPCKIFNESNPANTFNNMVMQQFYAKLEIGTPKQTILVPLELEKNDFYISKYDSYIFNEKYTKYNLKNFQETSSTSFYTMKDDQDNIYYGTNFLQALKVKDLFFFGDKKTELEFYLADTLNEIIPGELGLQLDPVDDLNSAFETREKSFLKKLKNNGMINNYVWTILYNNDANNKDADAYLYIGDYLHENDIKLGKNYLRVKLDYNLCGVQASEIIRVFLESNVFTPENHCHKSIFKYSTDFTFYYCDKNPSTISQIKTNFPSLKFIHQDFNFNFTITVDDLIVEKDDYFYFLIFFSNYQKYDWRLGRPFLNKYNFMMDQDGKKVLFYSEKEEISLPGVQSKSLVVILIILIIVFLVLGFVFARRIYKSKFKKPMNILEDNFEYTIEPNNSEIEMSKKLYD